MAVDKLGDLKNIHAKVTAIKVQMVLKYPNYYFYSKFF